MQVARLALPWVGSGVGDRRGSRLRDIQGLIGDPVSVHERLGGLSSRERELVEAVAVGEVLECSQLSLGQLAVTDNREHIIRAEVLRDLLVKRGDKSLDPQGVRLRGARITGMLDLSHVQAAVGMNLHCCCLEQAVLLDDACLPWLTLSGSCVPALYGEGLRVDGSVLLNEGFRATGGGERGAVRLPGARIGGRLDLSGAELTNYDGPALICDGFRVDGPVMLRENFRATGGGVLGAVRLLVARIGGPVDLSGAELTGLGGPALAGDGLQVDLGLFLKEVRATSVDSGRFGAVRLLGARIGGQLVLSGAELTNQDGPALIGDRLWVDGSVFLNDGFHVIGSGERGAVQLVGACISGMLNLRGAELTNLDGLILNLRDMEVKQACLPPEVICPKARAGRSACGDATRQVDLSEFIYTTHDGDCKEWLHLIARHTGQYWPQPYQQLAAVQRAAGHDSDARETLIAQQQDLRERGTIGGWLHRTVHRLWGLLGGYGYRVDRIALTLLVVLAAAGGLGVIAGHVPTSPGRYVAMHTPQAPTPDTPCSLIEQIGIGIDRGLPLSTTGIRNRCDFDTTSRRGQVMTAASWLLQAFVWALATLVVAGYSGMIRKTT